MWIEWVANPFQLKNIAFKECGGGGESQFLSIVEACKPKFNLTVSQLRIKMKDILLQLAPTLVENQLKSYKELFKTGKLHGLWDPTPLNTIEDLAKQLLKPIETKNGYAFEEDEFTLFLASQALKMNIYVCNLTYGRVFRTDTEFENTICLLYYDLPHFKHYQPLAQQINKTQIQSVLFAADIEHHKFDQYAHQLLSPTEVKPLERETKPSITEKHMSKPNTSEKEVVITQILSPPPVQPLSLTSQVFLKMCYYLEQSAKCCSF